MSLSTLVTEFTPILLSGEDISYSEDPFQYLGVERAMLSLLDQEQIIKRSNKDLFENLYKIQLFKEEEDSPEEEKPLVLPNFTSFKSEQPVSKPQQTSVTFQQPTSQTFSKKDLDLSLPEILKQEGVHFRVSSGYRGKGSLRNGLTKLGRRSNHNRLDSKGNPMAYDIVPNGISWKLLKKEIYGNKRILNYLQQRQWGIIDETRSDVKKRTGATGDHLHIGADSWGRRMLALYNLNPHMWMGLLGGEIPLIVSTFKAPQIKYNTLPKFFDPNDVNPILQGNAIDILNRNLFSNLINYQVEETKKKAKESMKNPITESPFYGNNWEKYQPSQATLVSIQPQQVQSSTQPQQVETKVRGNTPYAKAMNYFMDKKLSKHAAAGIVGNLYAESGLRTDAIGDGGTSGGIAQWHGPRWKQLKAFAKARNKKWTDLDLQLDFIWHELNSNYSSTYAKLLKAKNSDEAANIWGHDYERFKGYNNFNHSNYIKRRNYAKQFYNS